MADFLAQLREADRALADVAPSAALDARVRAAIASRSSRGERRGRRSGALVLAVSLGALLVGLRAIERRGAPSARPDEERAAVVAVPSASTEDSAAPRVAPSPVRRSADRSAPSAPSPDRRGPDPSRREGPAPTSRPRRAAPDARDLAPPPPLDGGADATRFEYVPGPSGLLHFERRGRIEYGAAAFGADGFVPPAAVRGPALRLGSLRGSSTPGEAGESDPDAPDAPPPSEALPEPTCETEVIDPGGCVDIGALKTQASEALCADGLYLSAFDIDLGSCGDALAAAAKYTCCPPVASPLPEEKPAEPPQSSNCKSISVSVSACAVFSALDEEAANQCGTGALVVDHKYLGDCPDGAATEGWFTCCAVAQDQAQDNPPG